MRTKQKKWELGRGDEGTSSARMCKTRQTEDREWKTHGAGRRGRQLGERGWIAHSAPVRRSAGGKQW